MNLRTNAILNEIALIKKEQENFYLKTMEILVKYENEGIDYLPIQTQSRESSSTNHRNKSKSPVSNLLKNSMNIKESLAKNKIDYIVKKKKNEYAKKNTIKTATHKQIESIIKSKVKNRPNISISQMKKQNKIKIGGNLIYNTTATSIKNGTINSPPFKETAKRSNTLYAKHIANSTIVKADSVYSNSNENKSEVKVFNKLKDYELSKFIKDYLKKFSFNIDNDALNLFINKLNDDLYVITSELDKMILYKDNKKTINLDDVRLVTSKIINSDIFDLIDAITKKNINEALALYDDLVLMQEEEIKLIVILANQFRLIYQVKEMYKMGYSELDIANSLDVHPYRVKLAKNIDISSNDAIKYLRKLANLDELIKTGKIDKKEGFYKFMLSI